MFDLMLDSHFYDTLPRYRGSYSHSREQFRYLLEEKDSQLFINVEVPGYSSSDIDVAQINQNVKIVATKNGKNKQVDFKIHQKYDASTCEASCKDGILTLTFKKVETDKNVRKIPVL